MPDGPYGEHLAESVHQGTAIIAVQAFCDMVEALALLIARAAELDRDLEDIALDVLGGVLRFDR